MIAQPDTDLKRFISSSTQSQDVVKYIAKDLVLNQPISTGTGPKPLVALAFAKASNNFLFTCDEYRHFALSDPY